VGGVPIVRKGGGTHAIKYIVSHGKERNGDWRKWTCYIDGPVDLKEKKFFEGRSSAIWSEGVIKRGGTRRSF